MTVEGRRRQQWRRAGDGKVGPNGFRRRRAPRERYDMFVAKYSTERQLPLGQAHRQRKNDIDSSAIAVDHLGDMGRATTGTVDFGNGPDERRRPGRFRGEVPGINGSALWSVLRAPGPARYRPRRPSTATATRGSTWRPDPADQADATHPTSSSPSTGPPTGRISGLSRSRASGG
jgi:hypothetical protein